MGAEAVSYETVGYGKTIPLCDGCSFISGGDYYFMYVDNGGDVIVNKRLGPGSYDLVKMMKNIGHVNNTIRADMWIESGRFHVCIMDNSSGTSRLYYRGYETGVSDVEVANISSEICKIVEGLDGHPHIFVGQTEYRWNGSAWASSSVLNRGIGDIIVNGSHYLALTSYSSAPTYSYGEFESRTSDSGAFTTKISPSSSVGAMSSTVRQIGATIYASGGFCIGGAGYYSTAIYNKSNWINSTYLDIYGGGSNCNLHIEDNALIFVNNSFHLFASYVLSDDINESITPDYNTTFTEATAVSSPYSKYFSADGGAYGYLLYNHNESFSSVVAIRLQAYTYNLSGYVRNVFSSQVIANANVSLNFSSENHSTISDSSGYYFFQELSDMYSYTVSKANYSNSTGTIIVTGTSHDFYLTPLIPDLFINSSYIAVGPEFPLVEQNITINFTVRNVGANATGVVLEVFDNNVSIENLTFGNLSMNESKTMNITRNYSAVGFHEILAVVDPDDAVSEVDETNNNATAWVNVGERYWNCEYRTEHFIINHCSYEYFIFPTGTTVDPTDDNNNNVPDFVEKMGDFFEKVYTYEVTELDYLPAGDSYDNEMYGYHVQLMDIGSDYGFVPPALVKLPGVTGSTIQINSELSFHNLPDADTNADGIIDDTFLLSNAGHEYYHGIQIRYLDILCFSNTLSNNENLWVMEGSPAWMEYKIARKYYPSIVKDESDELVFFYKRIDRFIGNIYETLKQQSDHRKYDAALFWWFLENYKDLDTVKSFWSSLDQTCGIWRQGGDPISAIEDATGEDFNDIFKTFAKANYFRDSWYPDDIQYARNTPFTSINLENNNSREIPVTSGGIDAMGEYGAFYFKITDIPANSNTSIIFESTTPGENYFISIFLAGVEDQGETHNASEGYSKILNSSESEGTVVIVGRLGDDTGDGDYKITFRDISPNNPETNPEIKPNETINDTKTIDSTVKQAYFNIEWEDGDLDQILIAPNGTVIDPQKAESDPDIDYVEGSTLEYYLVRNIEAGDWTLNITANDTSATQNVTVSTSLSSNITLYASTDKNLYEPNQTINITANLTQEGLGMNDSTVKATIIKPGSSENISMTNEGNGIYNALYNNTSTEGSYTIKVIANGTVGGTNFTRETTMGVTVQSLPDFEVNVSDIIFSNSTPKAGENITINATVWNVGDAEANATILIYDNTTLVNDTSAILEAGGNITFSTLWEVPTSGNHTIKVGVDPTHLVTERNESNNDANKSLNVSPAMKLRMVCWTDQVDYEQNDNVNISCDLYNYDWTNISVDSVQADINGTELDLTQDQNASNRYSGLFTQTSQIGIYVINITASKAAYVNYTTILAFKIIEATSTANCSGSEPIFSLDWNITQYTVCEDTDVSLAQNKTVNFFNETLILNSTEVNLNSSRMDFGSAGVLTMDNSTIWFW